MSGINKGKISSISGPIDRNGNPTTLRALPLTNPTMPTRELIIPWYLRGNMGQLKVNDEIVFALFDDLSGIVLARADGEWFEIVPGNVNIEKTLSVAQDIIAGENIAAGENITAKDVVTDEVASQNGHIHGNGNNGDDTTPPKG